MGTTFSGCRVLPYGTRVTDAEMRPFRLGLVPYVHGIHMVMIWICFVLMQGGVNLNMYLNVFMKKCRHPVAVRLISIYLYTCCYPRYKNRGQTPQSKKKSYVKSILWSSGSKLPPHKFSSKSVEPFLSYNWV